MQKFRIIKARKNHINAILNMIRELASYENKEHEVLCNEKKLKENLFKNKFARALILKENKTIIGYSIYFYTFSSFWGSGGIYLEDIYLKKEFRGKGYGKAVFAYLGKLCKKKKLKRLDWVCLNENQSGINFYEKLGSSHLNEWRSYRLSGEKLLRLCKL